jgi:soluble lytic murein transglycosylase-like protein
VAKPAVATPTQNAPPGVDPAVWAPLITKHAKAFGVDPIIMAAIVAQESSNRNLIVHRDGTGHGLIGLDDGGLKGDFEDEYDLKVGRGSNARRIPPEKQIEFLAMTLAEGTKDFGNVWVAVRAWHAGRAGRNRAEGKKYERDVKKRIPEVQHLYSQKPGAT